MPPLALGFRADQLREIEKSYLERMTPTCLMERALFDAPLTHFVIARRRDKVPDGIWYRHHQTQWRRCYNVDDFILAGIPVSPGIAVGFGLNRELNDQDYTLHHKRGVALLLSQLQPFFRKAAGQMLMPAPQPMQTITIDRARVQREVEAIV